MSVSRKWIIWTVYQLKICSQKTINMSPFETHLGRKSKTPLSNVRTEPNADHLTYKSIIYKNDNPERVRQEQCFSDEMWEDRSKSYTEMEENRRKATQRIDKKIMIRNTNQ